VAESTFLGAVVSDLVVSPPFMASNAVLIEFDLSEMDLRGARLNGAALAGADMTGANLTGAHLEGADLRAATLDDADLSGANLSAANLEGASLAAANLSDAVLRGVRKLRFDDNEILGARLTVRHANDDERGFGRLLRSPFVLRETDDPWSLLRRTYTGTNLILSLLALLPFALPLFLASLGPAVVVDDGGGSEPGLVAGGARVVTTGGLVRAGETYRQASDGELVWTVAFSRAAGDLGVAVSVVTALAIAACIVVRFWLTSKVSPLRDGEERSGVTPSRVDYEPLYTIHLAARPLVLVALILALVTGGWYVSRIVAVPLGHLPL
jgi:hypothetical protein